MKTELPTSWQHRIGRCPRKEASSSQGGVGSSWKRRPHGVSGRARDGSGAGSQVVQQPCGMEGIGACGITHLHTAEVTMGPGWGPGAYKSEPAAIPGAAPRAERVGGVEKGSPSSCTRGSHRSIRAPGTAASWLSSCPSLPARTQRGRATGPGGWAQCAQEGAAPRETPGLLGVLAVRPQPCAGSP